MGGDDCVNVLGGLAAFRAYTRVFTRVSVHGNPVTSGALKGRSNPEFREDLKPFITV